jgi:DNA-binding response OmpR family regulator
MTQQTGATHEPAQAVERRVLIVDDEPSIRDVLGEYLTAAGFQIALAADGPSALRLAERQPPDLVVLDIMLPGMDGLEVLARLRETSAVPIILLTARDAENDKLIGFEVGADDYVTKPFSPREVVKRVQAIMRRRDATTVPAMLLEDTLHVGGLVIRPALRVVEREGAPLELTAREFDLLLFLANHPRHVFSRQQLLDSVWGYDAYVDPSTVTVHMRRLREKVEADPSNPVHLHTVWGVGYKFEP